MSNYKEVDINKSKNIFSKLYEIFWECRHYTTYPILFLIVMPLLSLFSIFYLLFNIPNILHYTSQMLVTIVENSAVASLYQNNILHYLNTNFSTLDIKIMVVGCYLIAPVLFGYFIIKIAKRIEDSAKHSILAIVLLFITSIAIANIPAILKLDAPLFTQQKKI